MTKITNLNKAALIALRPTLDAELAALGERLGLKFQVGSGKYEASGAEASFKLQITVDDPAAQTAAAKMKWDANCAYIGVDYSKDPGTTGLRPEDFGTEFEMRGTRYQTTHLALGRSKYPIGVKVLNGPKAGQPLLFTEQVVPIIRAATDAKAPATADA